MSKKVAVYLRVSTSGQSIDSQRRALRKVAKQHEWQIVAEYADEGVSDTKGRDKRPAFDQLCKDATRGKFKLVMSWSVDRLGRSLQQLVVFVNKMEAINCGLYLHQQAVDTTTPAGKALIGMSAVFGEFETAMTRERVRAGLDRARARGKTLGRPRTSAVKESKIVGLRQQGKGIHRIANEVGCGVSVVQRVIAAM